MHYSLHSLTVGIQGLCNGIKQSQDEGDESELKKKKKNLIHQWDVEASGIQYSLPSRPWDPILDNQYFTNRTIFCFCGNSSSDDGFTMRQDGALCAGRML